MKPTQEQVIAWAREAGMIGTGAAGNELERLYREAILDALPRFAAFTYEAGRKNENEACAKQVGQQWDAFQELKAAYYRHSPEPFDPFRFHKDLSTIFFSRDMADAIRARGQE